MRCSINILFVIALQALCGCGSSMQPRSPEGCATEFTVLHTDGKPQAERVIVVTETRSSWFFALLGSLPKKVPIATYKTNAAGKARVEYTRKQSVALHTIDGFGATRIDDLTIHQTGPCVASKTVFDE